MHCELFRRNARHPIGYLTVLVNHINFQSSDHLVLIHCNHVALLDKHTMAPVTRPDSGNAAL